MRSKLGRPSGRPRSRSSLLGHPAASPEKAKPLFPPPPAPPSSKTAPRSGGLLTLTLRGKAMDGFEEQQEQNRPQLSPPSLENRRNGCRFSTSVNRPAALRRVAFARPFSSPRTEHTIDGSQTPGNTTNPSTESGQAQVRPGTRRGCRDVGVRVRLRSRVRLATPSSGSGTRVCADRGSRS